MPKHTQPLVRPLSPFWQYSKWPSMFLSIFHRITGVALTLGSILLVYWLTAAAMGTQTYARALDLFANPLVQLCVVGFVFSFCYHFLNGIRHLVWDTGRGFDPRVARMSGYTVLLGAVIFTAIIVAVFWTRAGGWV